MSGQDLERREKYTRLGRRHKLQDVVALPRVMFLFFGNVSGKSPKVWVMITLFYGENPTGYSVGLTSKYPIGV